MNDKVQRQAVLQGCLGKSVDMRALVDYSADSIVSKTVIDKAVGTVTLFAFDVGQRLSTHSAPYDALVQVIDGKALVNIDGSDIEVTAGQVIIMPANIPHAVTAKEKFKMLLTMIRA